MLRRALIHEAGPPLSFKNRIIPKGALPMGDMPLAERSARNLFAAGVEEIFIVAENGADWYSKLAARYPGLRLLPPGAAWLEECGDALVLLSDVLYETAALTLLLNEHRRDVQLASAAKEPSGICRLSGNKLAASLHEAISGAPLRPCDRLLWSRIQSPEQREEAENSLLPQIREADALRQVRREVLLNPGPATTSDSVKYAQVCADICPREQDFGEIMAWICGELSMMAGKPGRVETVLFGGSGTAADEAMISSCVPDEARLLILDNGAYGERLAKIASVYKLNFDIYKSSGAAPLDLAALKDKLTAGNFTHFALVYHETTTGLLNPAPELCRFCQEKGITTIVDAVSAFAAIPIDMDRDGFDFMASTSNKNIQGMAGVAFVFCRKEALEKTALYPMRNYYLNLWDQHAHFKKTGQTRFTPPVQSLYALRQAIIETRLEGIENRYARYAACWEILAGAVKKLGLSMLVPEEAQAKLITAILEPASPDYSFASLHDFARAGGFTIYPGKLSGADTFRIANIGDIRPEEMTAFADLLAGYMRSLGAAENRP
ncbi:MAG: 2-aminoethylphosphonate--pyruvate transaminase [Desulfovibrionaceae bacterium]|nr:2-aminoethylphosphonate--pyruvate transaminase [Desulfovibrionaceae bacterium]